MNKLSELEDQLFEKLKKYPQLFAFYEEMFRVRVKKDDWLENDLVRYVFLMNNQDEGLEIINNSIDYAIKNNCKDVIDQLQTELKGSEGGFDGHFHDLWAELNALSYLIDNKYKNIKKIPRKNGKTPDFETTKDGKKYLIEVKNFRVSSNLLNYVVIQLEVKRMLNPELYNKSFIISLKYQENSDDIFDEIDKYNVLNFINNLENYLIDDSRNEITCKYKKQILGRKINKRIICNVKEDSLCSIIGIENLNIDDPLDIKDEKLLLPLTSKLGRKALEAVEQLLGYKSEKEYQRWILVNWQKPSYFKHFENCSDKFIEISKKYNDQLIIINPNLYLEVL